ncbi:hypothetical protein GCM10009000_008830 [Halobacterium noricense]
MDLSTELGISIDAVFRDIESVSFVFRCNSCLTKYLRDGEYEMGRDNGPNCNYENTKHLRSERVNSESLCRNEGECEYSQYTS